MKKIKVNSLKENKLNEMCGGETHMQEPQPEPVMGPVIGIGVDDEPCGCPDMLHNHNNDEGSMARSQLMHMRNYAEELTQMITDQDNLPEWVELKITLANDYIAKVKHYLEGETAREQGMLESMKKDPFALSTPSETISKIISMMQGMKQTELDSIYHYVKNQKKSKYQDLSPEDASHNQKLLKKQEMEKMKRWGTPEDEREQQRAFGGLEETRKVKIIKLT